MFTEHDMEQLRIETHNYDSVEPMEGGKEG